LIFEKGVSMVEQKQITDIVSQTLVEIAGNQGIAVDEAVTGESRIIGKGGLLDSLAFVSFVVAVEQKINAAYGRQISLSNEKAFAQKQNPFRSVGNLVDYIAAALRKEGN
jgi:acyl carrier protein